jgi:dolichol-phosphate mannosyltransferase
MRCVIVIPTYDEADNIRPIVDSLYEFVPDADILVMDDNSPDGTADIAEAHFASRPEYARHRVVRRTGIRGLGRAYVDGFQRALEEGYDRIVQMDADLSHDPKYVPALLKASETADLVIGSRYCGGGGVENWPLRRKILSRFAGWYVRAVTGIEIADPTAGFRCWTSSALRAVQLETVASEGYAFLVEMSYRAQRAGLRIVEVPIVFSDRRFGSSKISRRVIAESAVVPWRLRARRWQAPDRPLASGVTLPEL